MQHFFHQKMYFCRITIYRNMLGVKSIHEPIKGEFAKQFLTDVVRMIKSNQSGKKSAPKYKSGYVIHWK